MIILHVIFYLFIGVTFVQLFFYGYVFSNVKPQKRASIPSHTPPISVIVCAKNEAKNLTHFLPFILDQDYPNFELVLINDSSNDTTLKVMEGFKASHPNIKVVDVKNIEAFWGNKKYALTLGVKAATHNHLLFTDADCKPVSQHWISEMSSYFSHDHHLIIGNGAYIKVKKSMLNKLIRFETLMTAIQYFSYSKLGHPYMGVGRNMAYTKELFFEARGFMDHMHIKSGDDDLFVNQIGHAKNTATCLSKDSFTESVAKKTYSDWLIQKRRHVSTATHYKTKHKIALSLFFTSQLFFFALALVLLSTLFYWQIVMGLIMVRYIALFINLTFASKKLNEHDLIPYFPLLEILLIVTQFSIFITNLISKSNRWK